MRKLIFAFLAISFLCGRAQQLAEGEYFIDNDPGAGSATTFTFTQADSINLPLSIPAGSLAPGYHKLCVRIKNTSGTWGLFEEHQFYIMDTTQYSPPAVPKIAAMEYFFDNTDYGPGQCAYLNPFTPFDSLTLGTSIIAVDPIFMTPLSVGQHTLNIRAQDLAGKWGMTHSVPFTVCNQSATAAYTYSVAGTTVTFNNTSANSFGSQWIFGDGTTSSQTSPVHTYNNGGTLNVGLISYSGCGNDTVWQLITLNCVSPTPSFTSSVNNLSVTFNTATSGSSYYWDFGDTKTSAVQNPTHIYNSSGTYTVCLTVTNGCGSNMICQAVNVTCVTPVAGYSVNINGFTANCTNTSTNAANFIWNFGDGVTDNINYHTVHQYTASGTYNLRITVSNGCGANIYQAPVTIACAAPTATFDTYTDGLDLQVDNNSINGTSYSWNFGDGSTSLFLNPPIHSYSVTGTYTVSLTATNGCGSATYTQTVTVCTAPVANYTYSANANTLTFSNTSTNATSSYWNFGDGLISNISAPVHTYATAGTYTACLNTSNICGTDQYCQVINVLCSNLTPPQICMVTTDSISLNNVIYWDKTPYAHVDSFIIHREVSTGIYVQVGAVKQSALSMFTDVNRLIGPANGDPNIGYYRYKLQIRDTCGNYSALGPYHTSVYFIDNHNGTFTWNIYDVEGQVTPVSNFVLYRDSANIGDWRPVGFVAGSTTTLNDPTYFTYMSIANWRVYALGMSCTPTAKYGYGAPQGTIIKSKSNITNNRTTHVQSAGISGVSLFPNPTAGKMWVHLERKAAGVIRIQVLNLLGEKVQEIQVYEQDFSLDVYDLRAGVYYLKTSDPETPLTKFIKE